MLVDVCLRVQLGQVVGLLGRSGSGKSVLLQTTFGARAVPDAPVRVNGRYVAPVFRVPGLVNYWSPAFLLPLCDIVYLLRQSRLLKLGVTSKRRCATTGIWPAKTGQLRAASFRRKNI